MTDDFARSALDNDDDAYTVRPYTVTGGRVAGEADGLALEALVTTRTDGKPLKGLTPEKKKILQLAAEDFISVAELSAHCRLPLGVVRVLVTDLSEHEYLTIHATSPVSVTVEDRSGITRSLLESVLDGIAAL
jgi:hypothetical protein